MAGPKVRTRVQSAVPTWASVTASIGVVSAALDVIRRSAWHTLAALAGFLLVPTFLVVFR